MLFHWKLEIGRTFALEIRLSRSEVGGISLGNTRIVDCFSTSSCNAKPASSARNLKIPRFEMRIEHPFTTIAIVHLGKRQQRII